MLPTPKPTTPRTHLFCDGCGKVHEDTDDFRMCKCGRVAVRMEWATADQIAESGRNAGGMARELAAQDSDNSNESNG